MHTLNDKRILYFLNWNLVCKKKNCRSNYDCWCVHLHLNANTLHDCKSIEREMRKIFAFLFHCSTTLYFRIKSNFWQFFFCLCQTKWPEHIYKIKNCTLFSTELGYPLEWNKISIVRTQISANQKWLAEIWWHEQKKHK